MASHPPTVYLRELPLQEAINTWLGGLFDRDNVDQTVAALLASQVRPGAMYVDKAAAKERAATAETKLRRFQAAIEAGVEPAALVEAINQAQAERAASSAELQADAADAGLSRAEICAMVDSLGDVGAALADARPERLAELYAGLGLHAWYDHEKQEAEVVIRPVGGRVNSVRVRGGT